MTLSAIISGMSATCNLMVFTDLDGTLIDHDTYEWSAANPALEALRRVSAGLVLASSKTAAEMARLRAKIGAERWPAIVENGAGVLPPFATQITESSEYGAVRSALNGLPEDLRDPFCGFGDVSATQVAQMTGLSKDDAALAQKRDFSEPGRWSGTRSQKDAFLAALAQNGLSAQQGGRFLTLSLGRNKVDQMRSLISAYKPRHTIALGDAPNDIAMLENADIGIIVANPARPPLPQLRNETSGRIIRTTDAGPKGWNQAVLDAIDRFDLKKGN